MHQQLVGIMSDSHDNRPAIQKAVDIFNSRQVGMVAHAGDIVSPFTHLDFKNLKCPMELVFGNNDGERIGLAAAFREIGTLLPGPRQFAFGGRRFLLMHENGCLEAAAASPALDIVIYGHDHELMVRQGPPLVINPGETGGWLGGRKTIAILNLESLQVEIVDL